MVTLNEELAAGEIVHLWLNGRPGAIASAGVALALAGTSIVLSPEESDDFVMRSFEARQAGRCEISWDDDATAVSLIYAFAPATVGETGVRTLWLTERNRQPAEGPLCHFRPPWGWMNDPNGLCETGDTVHLFYQHYPHGLRWNTMHWGHAVTRDLVTWTHQPIFLTPRPELTRSDARRGGAFSGSAIVNGESLRVFYTDRDDGRQPEREWQVTASSADGIAAGPSTPLIRERPDLPGFGNDFRDPYVFRGPDGCWKMILGGRDEAGGLVLLYESEQPEAASGWRFVDVLYRTDAFATGPCECPCMVRLEGAGAELWALFVGLLRSRDPATGRRNLGLAIVGSFDGRAFTPVATRELDIGTDCYAFQAFNSSRGPIGLGWAANWSEINRQADFPSAMTLWRKIVWTGERLLTPPADEMSALRAAMLSTSPSRGETIQLPEGAAELELEFREPRTPFVVRLEHQGSDLRLVHDGEVLELVHSSRADSPRCRATGVAVRNLRLFVDLGLIEVFVNDGELTCTKRLASTAPVQALVLEVEPHQVEREALWRLSAPAAQATGKTVKRQVGTAPPARSVASGRP